MDAAIGLIGVIAGALIALYSQRFQQRAGEDTDIRKVLLQQCANVVALEHDFRHRVFDHRERKLPNTLPEWPRSKRREAEAQILILSTNDQLRDQLLLLRRKGAALAAALEAADEQFRPAAEEHRTALWRFQDLAHGAVTELRRPRLFALERQGKARDLFLRTPPS